MKLLSFLILSLVTTFSFAADNVTVPNPVSAPPAVNAPGTVAITPDPKADLTAFARFEKDKATVNFSRISVADFVALAYSEVFQSPYVLHPAVVADPRIISLRIEITKKQRSQLKTLFDSLDIVVEKKNGVDLISFRDIPRDKEQEIFLYTPKYRDTSYLTNILRGLFNGSFTSTRKISAEGVTPSERPAPEGSASALIDQRPADILVFSGVEREVQKLKKLLPQVDTKIGEVILRAMVYEVNTSAADGSGFQLALNLLSSKLQLSIGEAPSSGQAVSFKTPAIEAVFTALASDGRFKTVSSPSIRVRSGGSGHFSVGQDVPVLGAVTYPGNGVAPVQSVEYRSSGVIFDVRPVVHETTVDLTLTQQISSFSNTSTGVNSSPTLIKREIRTDLSLTDGEVVVIGGLNESKESSGHSGLSFLPSYFHTKSSTTTQADIILVLQMKKL